MIFVLILRKALAFEEHYGPLFILSSVASAWRTGSSIFYFRCEHVGEKFKGKEPLTKVFWDNPIVPTNHRLIVVGWLCKFTEATGFAPHH